jgi:hypothetical protein
MTQYSLSKELVNLIHEGKSGEKPALDQGPS